MIKLDIIIMIYVAILMVLVGLLLFFYASITSSAPERKKEMNYHHSNPSKKNTSNDSDLKSKVFNMRYPDKKYTDAIDEKIRYQRTLNKTVLTSTESIGIMQNNISSPIEDEKELKPLFQPKTSESNERLKQEQKSFAHKKNDDYFHLDGILFIDFSRKIPHGSKKIKNTDWKEDAFTNFKRVGKVRMFQEEGIFQFTTGQLTHTYKVEELEQIVFYEKAFSFIPSSLNLPVPVFFTDELLKFKEYLSAG